MVERIEWISIKDKLPLEGEEPGVYGYYLVTVYPKDLDPNENPEIIILCFDSTSKQFSHVVGGVPYEDVHDHFISHWADLPAPAKRK